MALASLWHVLIAWLTARIAPAPPPPIPPPEPDPAPAPGTGQDHVLQLLAMHNAARAGVQLGALALDPALMGVAREHAQTMAAAGILSHDVGGPLTLRLAAHGYRFAHAGENVAAGYAGPGAVMQGWFGSPGHYANIVNPTFTAIGFGVADDARGVRFWCAVFALPRPAPGRAHAADPKAVVYVPMALLHRDLGHRPARPA